LTDTPVRKDYATAARNALFYADLEQALRALNVAQVPVIVLKGAALACTVYPSIAERPMGDVDLMIHIQDRDRARSALVSGGFPEQESLWRRFGLGGMVFDAEMAFGRPAGTLIELHWNLTASEWILHPSALKVAALFEDAQPLELGGLKTLQLSPPDTLLHLCVHLAHHGFAHPIGYTDISRLLSHYQPFPWEAFLSRVNRFRLRTSCYFPLEVSASALSAPIPQSVLDALRPPVWQQRLVRWIVDPRRVLADEAHNPTERGYLLHLAVADRPLAVLGALVWFFFPGPRHLAERYGLCGRLSPYLACLWHPLVALWRGAANAFMLARG
jgi:hypothetical protein